GKNSLNRLIRCVCGKKIGPDPRNFNQRVSLGRNDLLIRTFPKEDAIEVFKDWNISGDSAFSGQTEQPPSFASFLNTIKDKVKVTGSDKETD
ncbi:hypothetical protein AB6240_28765, partial [Klebsiella pneumoniae]